MSLELATSGNVQKVLPQSLGLEPELLLGGVIARANNYISASPENGYLPNQTITLALPFECLDLRGAQLSFTLAGTPAGGATFTRYERDIRSLFNRITVRFGSRYVMDTQQTGLLYNVLDQTYDVNWSSTVGSLTTGSGSTVQRNTDFLNPNKVYSVQLYANEDSFFYNVMPLHKLSVQCYIDFYLAPASEVIESDVNGATYVMNNVQFHVASLVPTNNWNDMFDMKISMNPSITYTYFTYEHLFDSNILQAGTSSCQKVLNYKYSSVIGVIFVMQDKRTGSQTQLNKMTKFNFNGVSIAYAKIGSSVYPVDQIRNSSDLLYMFAETMGLSMRFPFAGAVNFDSTNFIGAIPLARHIKENRDINLSLDGLNTSLGSSFTLTLGFTPNLPSAQDLHIWAIVENTITYNKNGSITFNN